MGVYFSLIRPSKDYIDEMIAARAEAEFTYPNVGASLQPHGASALSHHYRILHRRHPLGTGKEVYMRAQAALSNWRMYKLAWLEPCWPETPLAKGANVAILARTMGIWWINICRVIDTIQETGAVERCGFAYGTLHGSPISGEERITVAWNHQDDAVHYELFSFSRANWLAARLISFPMHAVQERFARDSARMMYSIANDTRLGR